MKDDDMAQGRGKSRLMRSVLAVSLALNLAVAGAVAGAAWRHLDRDKGRVRDDRGGAVYLQALPREDRRSLRDTLKANKLSRRPDISEMISALRQEPFDAAAARRVLQQERDSSLARQQAAGDAFLSVVSGMSAAERFSYADRLEVLAEARATRRQERRDAQD